MNDEFLYQFRKRPRREFADLLYQRISQPRRLAMFTGTLVRRVALGLAAVCLVLAVVLLVSPGARAMVQGTLRTIGVLQFEESKENPYMDGDETTISPQVMSLSEARAALPFAFGVPTWAPAGYVLQEQAVEVTYFSGEPPVPWVNVEWLEPSSHFGIRLYFRQSGVGNYPCGELVGPNSVEEVQVAGQPAAVVRGGWNVDTGEYGDISSGGLVRLVWEREGVCYTLDGATVEEMIQMAESVP